MQYRLIHVSLLWYTLIDKCIWTSAHEKKMRMRVLLRKRIVAKLQPRSSVCSILELYSNNADTQIHAMDLYIYIVIEKYFETFFH